MSRDADFLTVGLVVRLKGCDCSNSGGPRASRRAAQESGGAVREQCLRASTTIKPNHLLLYEPEFCERPAALSSAGQPEGPTNPGRLFFGYFLLAKQKKVTSRRATPGIGRRHKATVVLCEENCIPAQLRRLAGMTQEIAETHSATTPFHGHPQTKLPETIRQSPTFTNSYSNRQ